MGGVLAVANQKGGTGKSVVAVNVAVALGESGRRVLLCDLDPQGNAADMLGARVSGRPSWVSVFTGDSDVAGAVVPRVADGVDLAPAGEHSRLSGVEQGLVSVNAREHWLSRVLAEPRQRYDDVVIDCPPSLGQLATNALVAADEVLTPVNLTDRNAVKGVNELHRTILALREVGLEVPPPILVRNFVDGRLLTVRAFREQVAQLNLTVLDTEVPDAAAVSNGVAEGVPIVLREPRHPAAVAFRAVAAELRPRSGAKAA